ncbi:nSTAND1 domain-containing NTPase [Rhodococcus sp. OK302]|uniref:nSTAND1 domain-containing NTPase n=1 Tax=Rhodococcus sp. OK302 TaxID=1882769 RepID=UPI000B940D9A|nr:helix-turn-helix domain-containing protein [Rhodococcus sp. OK302]OYD67303.1 WD40 repeat protein [Rhodococcus sp. OK302]
MESQPEPGTGKRVDPEEIESRGQFAEALTALRKAAGLTVREAVDRSGGLHGTVSGWFSGQHLPTPASTPMFTKLLEACGIDSEEQRQRWLSAVQRVRQLTARRRGDTTVPYRGLESFRQEDTDWFFGREELTSVLAERVASAIRGETRRQFMVIGASGSGKSSLLRAGLAPKVDGDDPRFDGWKVEIAAPGSGTIPTVDDERRVLIVDQFEELWTQCDRDWREDFLQVLSEAGENTVVVIGLRADFYGLAAEEPLLLPLLDDSPMVVGPLTEQQLHEVIVKPALKSGMTVQPELVQVLVSELTPRGSHTASDPGSLPLLSHALLGTWQRSTRKTLTVSDYYATDGIAGAVQQSAEEVYGQLTERQQKLARRIFLRLVNVDEVTQTRRRAPRAELFLGDDVDDVNTVIDHFALRRLLTVDEETVEVSHEVLLSAWSRLRTWIDSDRAGLAVHRRFTYAAQVWEESGRDPSSLLGPARLQLTEEWLSSGDLGPALEPSETRAADLNVTERDFLAASIAHRDQQDSADRRRTIVLRRLVSALAAASVIALVLAVVATVAGIGANHQRAEANTARDEAMSRQVATEAVRMRDKDPSLAAQLALAAFDVNETTEARSAMLDASGVHSATRIVGPPGSMKARINHAGTVVAVASSDGMVRLYPVVDGAVSATPQSEFLGVSEGTALFAVSFSPDGRLLATGGAGGGALWDVSDPENPVRGTLFVDADHVVQDLEFSPDGTKLIAGTSTPDVLRWKIDSSTDAVALPPLPHPATGIVTATFSPDGRLMVAGGRQGTLRVWDVEKWEDPAVPPIFATEPDGTTVHFLGVAFSPDGRELAAGTTGREVARWDMSDPAHPVPVAALPGFSSYVNELNYSKDGTRLAAGSSDNTVRVWDPHTGALIEVLPDTGAITTVDYSEDGRTLVTGGLNGVTRVWAMPGPVWSGARDTIYTSPFAADGSRLLAGVGAKGGAILAWNTEDLEHPVLMPELAPIGEERFTGASALSADGDLAVAGTGSGAAYLWDLSDPAAPRLTAAPQEYVKGIVGVVALDPSGTLLAVSSQDDNGFALVDVSDPAAPKLLSLTDAGSYPQMMAFRPGDDILAIADAKNEVDLWDISDRNAPKIASTVGGFESYAQAVIFSADGKVMAAGSADHSLQLWNVENPSEPRALSRITGPEGAIYSVAVNPAGTLLSAGVSGGSLWLWDITNPEDPQRFAQLTAYPVRVNDAQFAGSANMIAGSGPDKTIRLWGTDPDAVSAGICSSAGTLITEKEWERYLPGVPYRDLCGS